MIPSLRPYQSSIISGIRKVAEKYKRIIAVGPTGCGKTIIGGHIAWKATQKNTRVFFLVHREEILRQTIQKFSLFGLQCGVIKSGERMTNNLVQVAMVQTLANRIDVLKGLGKVILIADEVHHYSAPTFKKVWNAFDGLSIGLTATPARTDGVGLIDIAETMVVGPPTAALVQNGYLCDPVVISSPMAKIIMKAKGKIKNGDYDKDSETEIVKPIINETVDMYAQYFKGAPCVIFCASVDDCLNVSASMRAAGWKCEAVYGDLDSDKRKEYMDSLGTGKLNAVCSYDVISEGVDVPILAGVILRRRTMSLIIYLQQVGRALRLSPGKTKALIIDQVGNVFTHLHPLEIREWTLLGGVKEPSNKKISLTDCPGCPAVLYGKPAFCPYCGYEFHDAPDKDKKEQRVIHAPLEIIKAPEIGEYSIEAADIIEYGNGEQEQELIDRTLRAMKNGDQSARDRFNAIMRMMGRKTMTEQIWSKYIEPEYERR